MFAEEFARKLCEREESREKKAKGKDTRGI